MHSGCRHKPTSLTGNLTSATATTTTIITTTTTCLLLLCLFYSLFSRTTWLSQYQKGKTRLDLNEARDDGVSECSGISWTICKQSAPCSRQITPPTPHRSVFTGRMHFLMPNQQCHSSEGINVTNVTG